ncbi:MAG: 1-deoxy-D-xylulose-5-phosphate reductoisomerase [Chloroflexi bacterium]|nr:1-deoxy-D-xylulose-5-phosphate reductoisomerase [Chloroflexota bacterium]
MMPSTASNQSSRPRRVVILGSTGSIGVQTLEVVRAHPGRFEVLGLACGANCDLLYRQIREFGARMACIRDVDPAAGDWPAGTERLPYPDGMAAMAGLAEADIVVVATVGDAGFRPTESALRAGNNVALASKEMLVMGGGLFRKLADTSGAAILPIDSEHSAIWQCLAGEAPESIRRLILTASGGPFRTWAMPEIRTATAEEALEHPNWDMGAKITVDSASLLNKGLEIIEAHWLFQVPYKAISVIVHPESIVHSMVEFHDGSIKAQLGVPDMRLPIQYAIGFPERLPETHAPLDLRTLSRLNFEPPDERRFPLLAAARAAGAVGGTAPATLCGADDAATAWFIETEGRFGTMTDAVQAAMDALPPAPLDDLDAALAAHRRGFEFVQARLADA